MNSEHESIESHEPTETAEEFTFDELLAVHEDIFRSGISRHPDETDTGYNARVTEAWNKVGKPQAVDALRSSEEKRALQAGKTPGGAREVTEKDVERYLVDASGIQMDADVIPAHTQEEVSTGVKDHAEAGDTQDAEREKLAEIEERYGATPSVVGFRERVTKLLQERAEGKEVTKAVSDAVYQMLTQRGEYVEAVAKYDGDAASYFADKRPLMDWYSEEREKLLTIDERSGGTLRANNNPGWVGIDTCPENGKKEGLNMKVYTTLRAEDYTAIEHLPVLAEQLRAVALETGDSIKVKMPNGYAGFVVHNDSVVVHFKDAKNAQKVEQIVDGWVQAHAARSQGAERELGRTRLAADASDASFSDRVAGTIAEWAVSHVDAYAPEQLAKIASLYAIKRSQHAPIVPGVEHTSSSEERFDTNAVQLKEYVEEPSDKKFEIKNSIGELISLGRDLETEEGKVYRSLGGVGAEAAIRDLFKNGVVRNRASAQGSADKSRWDAKVFWSAGRAGAYHSVQEGGYVLVADESVARSGPVELNDVRHIYTKRDGEVVDMLEKLRAEY